MSTDNDLLHALYLFCFVVSACIAAIIFGQ